MELGQPVKKVRMSSLRDNLWGRVADATAMRTRNSIWNVFSQFLWVTNKI